VPFARIDDDYYDHPKILAAGPAAERLWVRGIAYCNRYLTDGLLADSAVRRLADDDDAARLAERLVSVGLWERVPGGYRVHDFLDYQPSAEAVKRERQRNADRARTWREQHTSAGSTGARNGVSAPAPYPDPVNVPYPDPAGTPTPLPPSPQAGQGEGQATNQRRRRSRAGGEASTTPPAPPEVLSGPTDADRAVWETARLLAKHDLTPANAALLDGFAVAGRGADGGLRLRAPPGQGLGRFRGLVARALCDAGDDAGQHAAIV